MGIKLMTIGFDFVTWTLSAVSSMPGRCYMLSQYSSRGSAAQPPQLLLNGLRHNTLLEPALHSSNKKKGEMTGIEN